MKRKWLGLRVDTEEMEIIPRFYGGAWIDYPSYTVVNIVLPFNIPASYLRRIYLYMVRRFIAHDSIEEEIQRRARVMFHEWRERSIKNLVDDMMGKIK